MLALLAAVVLLAVSGVLHTRRGVLVPRLPPGLRGCSRVGYFVYLLFFAGLTAQRSASARSSWWRCSPRSVTFWAGYEQQGASFNLFAERYTDRHIFGWNMPAGVLQAVNPFFVITLAGGVRRAVDRARPARPRSRRRPPSSALA